MADYGLKVSKAGSNVLTASESNLLFNSEHLMLKAAAYGLVSTTGGSWYTISHSLGYSPSYMCWAKAASGSNRFLVPRFTIGPDPVGGQQYIYAYSTTTALKIITATDSDVYYYIFVDEL